MIRLHGKLFSQAQGRFAFTFTSHLMRSKLEWRGNFFDGTVKSETHCVCPGEDDPLPIDVRISQGKEVLPSMLANINTFKLH
jgi:hypothetical protein